MFGVVWWCVRIENARQTMVLTDTRFACME